MISNTYVAGTFYIVSPITSFAEIVIPDYATGLVYKAGLHSPSLKSFVGLEKTNLTYIEVDESYLSSFEGLPKSIIYIRVTGCRFRSFDHLPLSVSSLNVSHNVHLTSFDGLENHDKLLYLSCNYCPIKSFENLPSSLSNLCCNGAAISSFHGLPPGLRTLKCNCNALTSFIGLPLSIQKLECSGNNFGHLDLENYSNLIELECTGCELRSLKGLPRPSNLTRLDCSYNFIESLKGVESSTSLTYLNASHNQISSLNFLPRSLQYLDVSDNAVIDLKFLYPLRELQKLSLDDGCRISGFKWLPPSVWNIHIKYADTGLIHSLLCVDELQKANAFNRLAAWRQGRDCLRKIRAKMFLKLFLKASLTS